MSKSGLPVLDQGVCCSPLVHEPLGEEAAADLAGQGVAAVRPIREIAAPNPHPDRRTHR
jgi:ArsR family transcriptional regulator